MKICGKIIKGITANSREVLPGFIFVAVKGKCQDGKVFLKEALCKGASILVVEERMPAFKCPPGVKLLQVADTRKFLALNCAKFYRHPSKKVRVTGVTGTNGKTTITYLIEALAKSAGFSCGVIGTINYRFDNQKIAGSNTTPGPVELQKFLAQMLRRGMKYCALEVSSHALDQKRVAGLNFKTAIFTNLTRDHLDYHKNFKNYFLAKAKLFRNLPTQSSAIINNDDPYGRRLKSLTLARVVTYGLKRKSMIMAQDIVYGLQETQFTLIAPKIKSTLKVQLIGQYNIYNVLAAIAWGLTQNFSWEIIKSALEKFKFVPGRLERVNYKKGGDIFVDYAHTPDALLNVISTLRPLVKGKLRVIFGCGGERDRFKRPQMGRIVTQLADEAIITSDNPRSESPLVIINDIRKGILKNNYRIVPDRLTAIRQGVSLTRQGDCLLVAGKGHENYQIFKKKIVRFSDRKELLKCLASLK